LFEYNGGGAFGHTPFGVALLATYLLSRSKAKSEVSAWFRSWFNGTQERDPGALFEGSGRRGQFWTLVAEMDAIFGSSQCGVPVRFLRKKDQCREALGTCCCSHCNKPFPVTRSSSCLVPLRGCSKASDCLAELLRANEDCPSCHVKNHVTLEAQNTPSVLIIETTKAGGGAEYGVSSDFVLESSLTYGSAVYELISVAYFKNGNHFISDTLRLMPDGSFHFVRIDDYDKASDTADIRRAAVEAPTGKVNFYITSKL